jgi:predicted PurR-regulated permease PerM
MKPSRQQKRAAMRKNTSLDLSLLVFIAALGLIGWLIYLLGPILAPFLTAAILAYICDPLVTRLEKRGLGRTWGTLITLTTLFLAAVLFILILVPLFVTEARALYEQLPGFVTRLKTDFLPWVRDRFGVDIPLDPQDFAKWLRDNAGGAGEAAGSAAGLIAGHLFAGIRLGGLALVGFVINLLLVPVVMFYLLRDWPLLVARIDAFIPRRWQRKCRQLSSEVDAVLAEFLRGQLSVMVIMAALYTLALWAVGLQFALPVGMLTGLLVFVPYLGSVSGVALGTVAALMQFQSISAVIPIWIVFAVGQLLEGFVVTPWCVGDRIGLHPVVVIFSLLAFGQLFGFVGVLLALPLAAILLVALRHADEFYRATRFFRRAR